MSKSNNQGLSAKTKSLTAKIGRNEPCPCGSGKKFKKCHDRLPEVSFRDISGEYNNRLYKEFRKKHHCMHPEAPSDCRGQIIDCHTIQKNGVLKRICDDQKHIFSFYPTGKKESGHLVIHRIGINNASIFKGFCEKHDNEIFAPIEKKSFFSTEEQCFLIGYRAICHELYQKHAAMRAVSNNIQWISGDNAITNREELLHFLRVSEAGVKKGLKDFEALKSIYDSALKAKRYSDFRRCIIIFIGDISLASIGVMSPDFDIKGHKLQNIADPFISIEGIAVGTIGTETGGAIVFSWPRHFTLCEKFVNSLISHSTDLPSNLVTLFFSYIENTFFSKKWFDRLDRIKQRRIANFVCRTYGPKPVIYDLTNLVPWKITNILLD
jgi:hypothetical protein